jgi:hypothetical protein
LRDVHVHGNCVPMTTGSSGLVQDVGDLPYFTDKAVRFTANTYRSPTTARGGRGRMTTSPSRVGRPTATT